jgi:hypothetical protein
LESVVFFVEEAGGDVAFEAEGEGDFASLSLLSLSSCAASPIFAPVSSPSIALRRSSGLIPSASILCVNSSSSRPIFSRSSGVAFESRLLVLDIWPMTLDISAVSRLMNSSSDSSGLGPSGMGTEGLPGPDAGSVVVGLVGSLAVACDCACDGGCGALVLNWSRTSSRSSKSGSLSASFGGGGCAIVGCVVVEEEEEEWEVGR